MIILTDEQAKSIIEVIKEMNEIIIGEYNGYSGQATVDECIRILEESVEQGIDEVSE